MMVLREGMNMLELAHFKHLLSTAVALMLSSGNLCNGQDILKKEYHVEEEGGVGVHVGSPGRDSGLFSKFRTDIHLLMFQPFAQGNEHMPYFTVNASNGVVRTARNIDRETLCPGIKVCSVKLRIAVYRMSPSSESPTLLNLLEVVVIIDDINDNSPTFPSPVVSLPVAENLEANYQIETSVAVDADEEGPNSRVTYRLEPPRDMFELSTVKTADGVEDLVVTIKRTLDREEKGQYSLVVVATDLGDEPKSGSVLINILVKDMNDNAPYFSRLNYSVNVLENSDITVPVVVVSASDRDHGENARLTYSLGFQVPQDIKDSFVVDPETGNIFARKELDHESKQAYQFSVIVSDHGSPARSNFAYVSINVIDVNDNMPHIQINPAPGGESVVEHGSVGKFLAYIKVSDADSRDYGQVSCDMRDGNFILEPLDVTSRGIYKIKLRYALDREESSTRNVVIVCQDGDIRPLSASASFTVTVEDINDNPPQFIGSSLLGSVMENENENTDVLRVMAADPDQGRNGKISFAITSGNEKSLFAINEDNGVISTTEILDREVKSQYFLQVTASDHGYYSLTSSATVTINVLDENDNPPKFKKQAFFNNITENLPAGSEAGSIAAYDLDHGDNAKLVFSIVHEGLGSPDGLSFRVDRNRGILSSVVKFNREEKSTYKFRVKVADPGIASYYDIANVTVFIEDDNDHSPVVVKPLSGNRTFRCPFNTTVGEVITTFIATDNDDPELVKISYSIRNTNLNSPKWPLFSIDSISGKLRLARRIRPEDVTKHNLEVVVKDGPGITSQSAIVTISVIVEEGDAEAMRDFIDESATNIVVVIIIIAATLILAFIIVAVIYLIKRVDRKRHRQLPPASSDENNKLYQAAKWVSAMSVTKEIGPEEIRSILEIPLEEKKRKKEVSFSLADKMAGTTGDHQPLGKTVDIQLKTFQATEGLPLHLTARQEDYIVINGITTPDYSQHLYDPPTSSTDHQDDHHFMEVRHSDDRYSDASSGDTGTSDSGRGGSEDECHGHANSSTDGEKRRFAGSNSLNRGLNPKPNKKCNDTNSLKRMKQRQSSSRDGDDVPGSPTPLLSDRDRQSDSHHSSQHRPLDMDGNARLQRSFDKLPVRPTDSPSSARSSPSPSLTNQAPTYTRQPRYSSELLLLCHSDSDGPYRTHTGEQQHLLLQTFSSPNATGAPRYNSHPSWRRVKGSDPSRGPAPRKQYDEKKSTTDDPAIAAMDLTDVRSSDVLV